MDFRVEDLRLFVEVVRAGSFSGAARRLKLPRPSVSRRVATLEQRLGVRLLWRTTRRQRLTDIGSAFFARCEAALVQLDEAMRDVSRANETPRGRLRITGPHVVTSLVLGDSVAEYMGAYPEVSVEVDLGDRVVDLQADGYDLAIRHGSVVDDWLVAQRIGTIRRVLCAAPGYLERAGVPKSPDDLHAREFVTFESRGATPVIHLRKGARTITLSPSVRFQSNSIELLVGSITAGHGVAVVPYPMVADAIAAGRIVTLFDEWSAGSTSLNLVYAGGRLMTPKLKAFLDILRASLARRNWPWAAAIQGQGAAR